VVKIRIKKASVEKTDQLFPLPTRPEDRENEIFDRAAI
jgi:hypothetical protein